MTTLAQTLCTEKNVSFAQTFRYQYVIAPERLDLPGMPAEPVGSQWLHRGEALRRADLRDRNGRAFGVVLGIAVDHEGALPEEALARDFDSTAPDALARLERYLTRLAGRYALITTLAGGTHFHCDPVGMIGATCARETRRLAASPFLCIDRPVDPHPLYDAEAIAAGTGSYGFDHTCDAAVRRLNANHRFDLDAFTSQRFWPRAGDPVTAAPADYAAIHDEMIAAGRAIIDRMTALHPVALPLTGGYDSRILLALAGGDSRARLTQVFSHINTYANRRDSHVAEGLCRIAGLPYQRHDRKRNEIPRWKARKAMRRYRIASGGNPPPAEVANGLAQYVPEGAVVMRGHQTNVMRGQYIKTADPDRQRVARWQIRMMRLVGAGQFDATVAARFADDFKRVQGDFPAHVLADRAADFMFFETLVPAALGVLFPGQDHAFYLSPFNSRRLVQLSMQFDTAYRLMPGAVSTDFLLRADPALAQAPFGGELTPAMAADARTEALVQARLSASHARWQSGFTLWPEGAA